MYEMILVPMYGRCKGNQKAMIRLIKSSQKDINRILKISQKRLEIKDQRSRKVIEQEARNSCRSIIIFY